MRSVRTIKEDDWPFDIHTWRNNPEFLEQLESERKDAAGPFATVEELLEDLKTPDEEKVEKVAKRKKRSTKN